jgi:hypothetical protein
MVLRLLVSWVVCRRVVVNARLEIHTPTSPLSAPQGFLSIVDGWQHEAIGDLPTTNRLTDKKSMQSKNHWECTASNCLCGHHRLKRTHRFVSLLSLYIGRLTASSLVFYLSFFFPRKHQLHSNP